MRRLLTTQTRALVVLVFIAACFLAAQGTGLRLFFHLFYMLTALLVCSYLWAWSNLCGLDVRREPLTHRAHLGDYARERMAIRNRWIIPKLWFELQDHSNLPQHGGGFVAYLPARQHRRWTVRTLCTRRGRFRLGPATLISGDPFGIFRLERQLPGTSEIIVYPALVDLPQFALPDAELPGGRDIRGRTYNVTPNVSTVREYAPGDSFNRIHWRSTARAGRLMVKEFELDPTADMYIVLDMQERAVVTDTRAPSLRRPLFDRLLNSTAEYAVMTTASVARHLLAQNRVVGLIAWGQQREVLPAERGPRQLFRMLETLAVLRAHGTQPLAELLATESVYFGRNSMVIVVTASLDEHWPEALQHLLHRGVRALVLFVDPQSFGGWHDPQPILSRLAELHVPTYRLQHGQALPEALRAPVMVAGSRHAGVSTR